MYPVSPLSRSTHQRSGLADVARSCEVQCRLQFHLRFVGDCSEHTVLLGGAEPVEPCRPRAAITELFRGHSIYVSSELFQIRSDTAGLSNLEGAFIKFATSRNFVARTGRHLHCTSPCPLYPQERHRLRFSACLLWANSGLMQRSKSSLFDHLVEFFKASHFGNVFL